MDTHAHTRSRREGESALAVIAEMINKRLRFNPEGFSASHTQEERRKKGGSEKATALSFQRKQGMIGGAGGSEMECFWGRVK